MFLKRRPKNEDLRPKTPWTKTKTPWTKTKTPWTKTKTPWTKTTDANRWGQCPLPKFVTAIWEFCGISSAVFSCDNHVSGLGLNYKSECAGDFSAELSLVVTPYWRATTIAKQLSMATIPLCFQFFQCLVERWTLGTATVNSSPRTSLRCQLQFRYNSRISSYATV